MRWLFFALLFVNVALAAFQWLKHREQEVVPVFEQSSLASTILLLSDSDSESSGDRCVLIGPLVDEGVLKKLEERISKENGGMELVKQNVDKAPSYWVYALVGSESDNVSAILADLKIDSYKILSGELKGAYSLGVFDNVDLARKLVERAQKNGLNVQIREKENQDFTYWLEYKHDYAAENQEKIKEIEGFLPEQLKKREIFCKSVASQK